MIKRKKRASQMTTLNTHVTITFQTVILYKSIGIINKIK